jgi:hypothetical protein
MPQTLYNIIQLTPHWVFSDWLYQVLRLLTYLTYLAQTIYLYNNHDITFWTTFILTHPANLPRGRKPERPEKTHDFRQSVDWLFSHESVARIKPTISEVKGTCSDPLMYISANDIKKPCRFPTRLLMDKTENFQGTF